MAAAADRRLARSPPAACAWVGLDGREAELIRIDENAVREGTPTLKVVHDDAGAGEAGSVGGSVLDELARDGARQMLAAALRAEVVVHSPVGEVDADKGHRLVVRNGYHQPRAVMTAAGAVPVTQPRVNDKRVAEETGKRRRFSSAILPAWSRKSPQVAEVLPVGVSARAVHV